jgi:hypothetical protein
MRFRIVRFHIVAGIAWGLAVAFWAGVAGGAAEPKPLPPLSEVREIVLRHFALLPDYRPGDIIARSEVEPLFLQLQLIGWTVTDRKAILRKVPADNDFLIRKLGTSRGRKFMRRIANYPNAYDRLDRLSWLPRGRQTVHDLIHKTGGEEMIKYLTTASGGTELGKMLSKAPKGTNFNKPTGRIYTVKMLWDRLKKSHAEAKKAASRLKAVKRAAGRSAKKPGAAGKKAGP